MPACVGGPPVAEQHQVTRAQLVGWQGLPPALQCGHGARCLQAGSVRYTQAISPLQSKPPCGVLPPYR
jgi:hypothetical protein